LILLGLLAVLAVSLVATALATEPPAKCGGKVEKVPDYCVSGFELENAKGEPVAEKVEGTNGSSILKATIASTTAEIKCEKGKSTGSIEGGAAGTVGKSTTITKYEGCKLLKPVNCRLTPEDENEIETTSLKGALALTAGRVEDKLEPKEGAAFAGISIEGKEPSCVIAEVEKPKTFNVTGSQLCEVDKNNAETEAEAITHKILCKTSGSSLKIGGNKAEMTSEATVKLISGKKWSVKEDT
jgi:hypothetical protein